LPLYLEGIIDKQHINTLYYRLIKKALGISKTVKCNDMFVHLGMKNVSDICDKFQKEVDWKY
jgi:hypothetical protein